MSYSKVMQKFGLSRNTEAGAAPLTRRQFLKLSGLSGLAIGVAPAIASSPPPAAPSAALGPRQLPAEFLHIAPDGAVTIQINRLEFGQGSHTGLARILAEELDADWDQVTAQLAPAGDAYKDPLFGIQMTGGSTAIAHSYMQYRELGARARAMLVGAAAQHWSVDAATIRTSAGVLHGPDGATATYGEMAEAAMAQPVPQEVTLKPHADFRFIGHGIQRLDTAAKSTGQQQFGIDAYRPNMRTVLIARPPHFGGTVKSVDDAAARKVRGVVDVLTVELDRGATGVAVFADGYWPAKQGRDALKIEWNAPTSVADSDQLTSEFKALLGETGAVARSADLTRMAEAAETITADFRFPFLAHTPMEPLNAVIEMTGSGDDPHCAVWTGTQFQTIDQATVAGVLGLNPAQVSINTMFAGGGFGRRATPTSDYLADTARVMKAWRAAGHSAPLKLVWSREDDVRGGYYRPFTMHRAEIGLDANGQVLGWRHRVVSPSILKGTAFEPMLVQEGIDSTATEGIADTPYALPINLEVHHPDVPVPVLWWRSVGHTHTAFVIETLIDQIARRQGKDPVALRRELLVEHPRHLAALNLAVEQSGYERRQLPVGQAWGVAVHASFGSVVAHVARVSMENGRPRVHDVTSGVHCNTAVNPLSVQAQIEGAALMGLGTLLEGAEITLKDGKVQQSNFHDYAVARMPDMPDMAVHIVPSQDPPTGVGEPGLPPMAPAVANAVFTLTGKPVRELPMAAG